jgi:hypothetical protein
VARLASPEISEQIDFFLDRLFLRWAELPSVEDFEGWDVIDQIVFIEEWAIPRSHLELLEGRRAENLLGEWQEARYQDLVRLMAEKQPLLDEILKD